MTPSHVLASVALGACAAIVACASSDADVSKTAADAAIVANPVPSGSVLSPGFDPQSLAPGGPEPASSSDGHDHHHHHHP